MADNKHENYETLNLLGYGLAKFDKEFVSILGFQTKQAFYQYLVSIGVAETASVIKNRQDLFDPFFDNDRKGWWQKGNAYIHRKIFIDSLFGDLDVKKYAEIIRIHLRHQFMAEPAIDTIPILQSKFREMQNTGREAELFFFNNYSVIPQFSGGIIEDARLLGDGYDFQIDVSGIYYLAEVKGVREDKGHIRMTEKEFVKAEEFGEKYVLSVISDLNKIPRISTIFNPLNRIEFTERTIQSETVNYESRFLNWAKY